MSAFNPEGAPSDYVPPAAGLVAAYRATGFDLDLGGDQIDEVRAVAVAAHAAGIAPMPKESYTTGRWGVYARQPWPGVGAKYLGGRYMVTFACGTTVIVGTDGSTATGVVHGALPGSTSVFSSVEECDVALSKEDTFNNRQRRREAAQDALVALAAPVIGAKAAAEHRFIWKDPERALALVASGHTRILPDGWYHVTWIPGRARSARVIVWRGGARGKWVDVVAHKTYFDEAAAVAALAAL